MSWFDKLTGKAEPVAAPIPIAVAAPQVEPNDGIHHEYFVNDEPANGRIQWHARVYGTDSTPHGNSGSAETAEQAALDAQAWAADKKRELRGIT